MKESRWGDVCRLRYGKALRDYPKEPSEHEIYRVYGTNGPIGWTSQPISPHAGIVIGRKGAYRGVRFSAEPFFVIDTAYYLELTSQEVDLRWAYYKLLTVDINRMDVGAAIPTTNRDEFYAQQLKYPSLGAQRKAANILSAYDDLIDNNRRRMALLEEAARQLYREWFVRFRFPGHEHTRITGRVPAGWNNRVFADACESIEDGDWIETRDQGGEDFRLLQISNIGINELVETGNFRYVTDQTFNRLNCREVLPGQILISRMPKPIGRAWLVTEMPWRMITAVDVAIAVSNDDLADAYFLTYFLNSSASLEHCKRRATGATRPRVARRELAALPLLLPPRRLQKHFREVVEPLNQQRANLYRQNEKLRAGRDLLLPRLMSGEVAV